MITTLSDQLNLNHLTIVAITLCAESGQSVNALLHRIQEELADLAHDGILKNLTIFSGNELLVASLSNAPLTNYSETHSQQIDSASLIKDPPCSNTLLP